MRKVLFGGSFPCCHVKLKEVLCADFVLYGASMDPNARQRGSVVGLTSLLPLVARSRKWNPIKWDPGGMGELSDSGNMAKNSI